MENRFCKGIYNTLCILLYYYIIFWREGCGHYVKLMLSLILPFAIIYTPTSNLYLYLTKDSTYFIEYNNKKKKKLLRDL
jgi:hypothetical protein